MLIININQSRGMTNTKEIAQRPQVQSNKETYRKDHLNTHYRSIWKVNRYSKPSQYTRLAE
jgi:hypothetical protein